MKIEYTEVTGFEAAIRGMRNSWDSWDKSDSRFSFVGAEVGPADLALMRKLIRSGSSDRKFLRQITITADFALPLYVWTELDTYKVSTVRNSCSTMHKLGHRDLTAADFEQGVVLPEVLARLNALGAIYRESRHDTPTLLEMKRILPSGFLLRSTYQMNYETALSMYFQRRMHRLPEWSGPGGICEWIAQLPYMAVFLDAAG